MHGCSIGMFSACVCMSGLSVFHRLRQMLDPLIDVRIFHSRGFRVLQRFLRVLHTGIGMAFFSMRRGALCMFDRFSNVLVPGECRAAKRRHADQCAQTKQFAVCVLISWIDLTQHSSALSRMFGGWIKAENFL